MYDVYLERFRNETWRAPIFRDMLREEARRLGGRPRLLDIGCGRGFDDDLRLQESIAAFAGACIGVEPDSSIPLGAYFTETHRCLFEDAPIAPGSIDLAFAVMVLEHLSTPARFWAKVYEVLAPGGVFWGFTMDARHWFCTLSTWAGRLGIKGAYLNWIHGRIRKERYENYPVYYRSNSPEQITPHVGPFRSCEFFNFGRVGQLDFYLPGPLKRIGHLFDRRSLRLGRPGSILAVRVCK